jgi:hypothetical protein
MDEFIHFGLLIESQRINLAAQHLGIRNQFDSMVPYLSVWYTIK